MPTDPSHKSHNASWKNPTMHHFEQKCAHVCIFLLQNDALWDMAVVHCGICATDLLLCWEQEPLLSQHMAGSLSLMPTSWCHVSRCRLLSSPPWNRPSRISWGFFCSKRLSRWLLVRWLSAAGDPRSGRTLQAVFSGNNVKYFKIIYHFIYHLDQLGIT